MVEWIGGRPDQPPDTRLEHCPRCQKDFVVLLSDTVMTKGATHYLELVCKNCGAADARVASQSEADRYDAVFNQHQELIERDADSIAEQRIGEHQRLLPQDTVLHRADVDRWAQLLKNDRILPEDF